MALQGDTEDYFTSGQYDASYYQWQVEECDRRQARQEQLGSTTEVEETEINDENNYRCHSVVCPPFTMSPRTLFSSEYCPPGHYSLENFVPLGHYSLVNNVLPQ